MARRSLQASELGVLTIKKALKQEKWTQDFLAGKAGCSRQTIWSLLQGNPVDCDVFMAVCQHLGLNWEEIAKPDQPEAPVATNAQLDALVQEIRSRIQSYTQERCGTMRVLDMTQPIDLDNIYIQVNILQKMTRLRSTELAELLREGGLENFDRFCIGDIQQKRVPGLEAVQEFSKLMILGKPGAGKTTFLKHLAMQCIGGKFQRDRIPFFITLKEFAEADGRPGVLEFCNRLVEIGTIELFRNNRALVLLDGLDEVRETDASRVLQQIKDFSVQFPSNHFVITCRIAAREYVFEQFTDVEVADFSPEEVAKFVVNWFKYKNDPVKAEQFLEKLEEEKPIAELATSPLLLTLLCLVFEDSGSFPSNRAELYGTGVEVLLKKWDTKRNIDREQVYKGLSLKRKEDLLSWVARSTFEAGNYFFKQREAERLIGEYIQNLPNADPAVLEVDSGAVLKSIEAQHGLFVERARGIYSFSHLTLHEYFTARSIVEARDPATLKVLTDHLTEKRWREIFLLTFALLEKHEVDQLALQVSNQIQNILCRDLYLQNFLIWLNQKAFNSKSSYRKSAIRAFYISIVMAYSFHLELGSLLKLGMSVDPEIMSVQRCKPNEPTSILDTDLAIDLEYGRSLCHFKYHTVSNFFKRFFASSDSNIVLRQNLIELQEQLPSRDKFEDWCIEEGVNWSEELDQIMIQHRNIGHDWQFTNEQKQLLQQYYDANKLLVDCLNSDCYVSREVCQEIEDTLLLPLSEIENRTTP